MCSLTKTTNEHDVYHWSMSMSDSVYSVDCIIELSLPHRMHARLKRGHGKWCTASCCSLVMRLRMRQCPPILGQWLVATKPNPWPVLGANSCQHLPSLGQWLVATKPTPGQSLAPIVANTCQVLARGWWRQNQPLASPWSQLLPILAKSWPGVGFVATSPWPRLGICYWPRPSQ